MNDNFCQETTSKSILHVDGDGFFAGCEVAKDPTLKGKPVIVGRERGLALAMTYEAKAFGVKRGMNISEVRKLCPNAIWRDMDFVSYELFSARMNQVIGRYSPIVEHYSIDESFADISSAAGDRGAKELGLEIKETLKRELGMTFSIGIAPTKVLAKVASKHRKPDGLTVITQNDIRDILGQTPIGKIWGIGRATTRVLEESGISTALLFIKRPEQWVEANLAKPYQEIWRELSGISVLPLKTGTRDPYKSLMRTRTFGPPTSDRRFLLAELSRHAEVVASRAREEGLAGGALAFFLKTKEFHYSAKRVRLPRATHIPEELVRAIEEHIDEVYSDETSYRASGVTLLDLVPANPLQLDLFDAHARSLKLLHLYTHVDALNLRFHNPVVHLATSTHLLARNKKQHDVREKEAFARIGIPLIGEVG